MSLALCMILHSGKDYTILMSSVFGHLNSRILKRISSARAQFFDTCFFYLLGNSIQRARSSSFTSFLDHTQRRNTVGRTLLDEWPAPRRYLYLTTHNTQNKRTSVPPAGFETTISAGEWLQTNALDRAASGIGLPHVWLWKESSEDRGSGGPVSNTFQIWFYRAEWMTSKGSGHLASSNVVYTGQKWRQ